MAGSAGREGGLSSLENLTLLATSRGPGERVTVDDDKHSFFNENKALAQCRRAPTTGTRQ
jgi:hypothetical protein